MSIKSYMRGILPKWMWDTMRILLFPLLWVYRTVKYHIEIKNPKRTVDRLFYKRFGRHIDYENPRDLNEKIHWLQFYSDTSKWSLYADKYRVREYVKEKGYGHILNELYATYDRLEDINISDLPEQFAMKINNGCGDILIVRDKSQYTNTSIKKYFKPLFRQKLGVYMGEYHYWSIKPCVIAEKLLTEDNSSEYLTDYKFYCFDGKIEYILVTYDRSDKGVVLATYDTHWNYLSDAGVQTDHYFLRNGTDIPKPNSFSQMLDICRELSIGIPFVRIDLYEINGIPVFGEMTMTPAGGFITYYTSDFLVSLGEMINIDRNTSINE